MCRECLLVEKRFELVNHKCVHALTDRVKKFKEKNSNLKQKIGLEVNLVNAQETFLKKLKGIKDPEEKNNWADEHPDIVKRLLEAHKSQL